MTCRAASDAPSTKSDLFTFFRAWTANPLQVASIIPSSDALSDLITSEISSTTGPVIELGPGTGVFTRALLDRGVKERDLTLIEYGSEFAAMLKTRFPEARVLWMDAQRLGQLRPYEGRPAGTVVSGLPLLSMSPRKVFAILMGSFRLMGEDGKFYQFTYGPRCPIPRRILDRLGLKAVRIGWTSRNIPPASVYRISMKH
ncbi:rRNA adenine N-6-methyltransferase family protein [Hyphomicrobium sp. CS1GBMeth3]|uniref:class I SAM-dependent methyltransferase n=1 Tax=Hyphomicrobium sp. CS1GBMeth3 TaxID=1892845 RepID=UPI0009311BDC|nr:rRNA adenine N-6-methyltransferase family protein [Hyphomicrobium sp. CS1GBMeth3]